MDDNTRAGLEAGERCLQAALGYLEMGWSVLCLCPPDHVGVGKSHGAGCDHPGKRPLADAGQWKRWHSERADEATVRRWWREHPNANVGLVTGEVSGVVDVDTDGPEGEAKLLEMSGGDLPVTLEFTTGAGRRRLYRAPSGVRLRTTHRHGRHETLTFQANGAQTVMPPSRHASGRDYAWVPGRGPGEVELAPAPLWLSAVLVEGGRLDGMFDGLGDGETIPQGKRDVTLTRVAGSLRKYGCDQEEIYGTLAVVNRRCEPPLPDEQLQKIARSICKHDPDPLATVVVKPHGDPMEEIRQKLEGVEAWDHDALMRATFPPQEWVVDDLVVADGLTVIGGKKKLGKSWLCLQIAQAVATGGEVLGKRCRHPGPVYYLCLEDGARRLQGRLSAARQSAPAGLPIRWYTRFPRLDKGGVAELIKLCREGPRLVVIDTIAAAKSGLLDENAAGPMADLFNDLRQLAQFFGVAILVVAHHGKRESSGDVGDDIRGSSAIGGAADVNLGLYRTRQRNADGTDDEGAPVTWWLRGEGRDIPELAICVRFDANATWRWLVTQDGTQRAGAKRSAAAEGRLLAALREMGPSDAAEIGEAVGVGRATASLLLNRLRAEGHVSVVRDGRRTLFVVRETGSSGRDRDGSEVL